MRKINHIQKKSIELKRCSRCKEYLPLKDFCKNVSYWDNLNNLCIKCESRRRKHNLTISTNNVWRNLVKRVKKDSNYLRRKVKIKFTEEEFKEWYIKRWFAGCVLDRINNEGDYEFGNIHIITKAEHNKKQRQDMLKKHNIIEPEGMRYCRNCNQIKPINEFYRKKWRISLYNLIGLDSRCKECNRKARRDNYNKLKIKLVEYFNPEIEDFWATINFKTQKRIYRIVHHDEQTRIKNITQKELNNWWQKLPIMLIEYIYISIKTNTSIFTNFKVGYKKNDKSNK